MQLNGPRPNDKRKKTQLYIGYALLVVVMLVILFYASISGYIENGNLYVTGITDTLSIELADIEDVKLLESLEAGTRTSGLANVRALMGTFYNDAYGAYKLYAFKRVPVFIEVTYEEGRTLVFNLRKEALTRSFYDELLDAVG